jgi:hypothetical protein
MDIREALKGRSIIAQGIALGIEIYIFFKP